MRSKTLLRWFAAASATMLASLASAQVRISEIHYDNAGTDTGEAIEVSAPAGTDLSGWTVVLYNGSNGASYDSDPLPTTVPATCGARGVVVINYAPNGIQNGPPDAIALVDAASNVVEFISYEGVFAATNGPAAALTSIDIGALQGGSGPVGESLQRNAAGVWSLGASTFGACNDGGDQPPAPEVASILVSPSNVQITVGSAVSLSATAYDAVNSSIPNVPFTWSTSNSAVATVSSTGVVTGISFGDVLISASAPNGVQGHSPIQVRNGTTQPPSSSFFISELHYDNLGTDTGEAIEIGGPSNASVEGFSIVLYNGSNSAPYGTPTVLHGTLPESCGAVGVTVANYPQDGIQNGSPDAIALVDNLGQVIEFISYEGVLTAVGGPANGLTSVDIGVSQTNATPGTSLQRHQTGTWLSGLSSFGDCNASDPTPPRSIFITGRDPTGDVPLPVGYEDQIFAQLRENGANVPSTFTWTSETPDLATIDADGVIRALAAGSARFRATAADGTTSTITLPTRVAEPSATALYADNAEFGEPRDADASDDLIVRRPQYTSSYSPVRNSPNWVAYEIDPTHFGPEDRCDCFTMDPELPSGLPRIDTNDYTGSGAIAGYGIDRGHLARSFDRTSGSLDNATTFLLTNIIPQAADQNQGPWAQLENDLGNLVRTQGKEVYVIAGVAGNKGTLKNEGKVIIPTHTWKVALVLPHDQGLSDIRDYRDVQAIAVVMPNEPGIRNVPWQTYLTTVDAVETLSGYDLLALLLDEIEVAVESNTQPPIGVITIPPDVFYEGDTVALSAAASLDPNGSIVSYSWDFGDGTVGSGVSVTHRYPQAGAYPARLMLTDNDGLTSTSLFYVNVANVTPVVTGTFVSNVDVGVPYTVTGTIEDPGADTWTATVDWGDGSPVETTPLQGRAFELTHTFARAGVYTGAITIFDDESAAAPLRFIVQVSQPAPGLGAALPLIDQLVAGKKMPLAVGLAFKIQVVAAQKLITRGSAQSAKVLLQAMVVELDLLARLRVVRAADVAPLRAVLVSSIAAL